MELRHHLMIGGALVAIAGVGIGAVIVPPMLEAKAKLEAAMPLLEHVEAVNRGNYDGAYAAFTAGYQDRVSLEDFKALVKANPELYRDGDFSFDVHLAGDTAELEVERESIGATFTLARSGDGWLIDDMELPNATPASTPAAGEAPTPEPTIPPRPYGGGK